MSLLLVICLIATLILIQSQFGGKIAASTAWHWWVVGVFLVIAAINPNILRPIADLFGIQFISNFVFAVLTMTLFSHSVSFQAQSTMIKRQIRLLVTKEALNQAKIVDIGPIETLIIVPVFNEEACIQKVASDIHAEIRNNAKIQVCYINDGSRDKTPELLNQLTHGIVLHHSVNMGVSGVIQTGFSLAQKLGANTVIQFDGDGQHPASQLPLLIKTFHANLSTDCIIGSRFCGLTLMNRLTNQSTSLLRSLANLTLCWVINALFDTRITDPTSGFRVYSRRAIDYLVNHLPDDYPEPETIALLRCQGLNVKDVLVR